MVCNYLSIYSNLKLTCFVDFPRKRKILVLVNPFSGRRLAATNWEIVRPILDKAHIDMTIVMT